MSTNTHRTGSRALVALCAATALLLGLMAMPASAQQSVYGELAGGAIVLGGPQDPDAEFPLGDDSEPSQLCNPNEDKSTVMADKGNGVLSNFQFNFAPGGVDTDGGEICAQLVVTNQAAIEGAYDDQTGDLAIPADPSDPTITVDVIFFGGFLMPAGCGIYGVDIGQLLGKANPANDEWFLETSMANQFTVPETMGCGLWAAPIDNELNLENEGYAFFEFDIVKS